MDLISWKTLEVIKESDLFTAFGTYFQIRW